MQRRITAIADKRYALRSASRAQDRRGTPAFSRLPYRDGGWWETVTVAAPKGRAPDKEGRSRVGCLLAGVRR